MGRRLLLVEDSGIMRRMISAMLEEEGYEVAVAVDGREGLAKAGEVDPELILTDFEMPELDGAGLCQALKADRKLRSIPVVMLTSLGATASKVVGLDAGADDYIEKPKTPDDVKEVFARIRAQLRIADLRRELAERNAELEAAQAKLRHELELARKVQMGLMPRAPKPRGVLRYAVRYQPTNMLGGDVYDFYRLDGDRLGVLIADVTGHGVNSALLSTMVKALAGPVAGAGAEPGQVMEALDSALEKYFPESYFLTAFYLLIDEATGTFRYSGVGHPPALIASPAGIRQLDAEAGLLGIGMAMGNPTATGQLAAGESLLLYTDGLTDAMNPQDVLFNQERIEAVLTAHRQADPETILTEMEQAVARHVEPGSAADDINMVLVQYPAAEPSRAEPSRTALH
jgi:sigma-B regulation protein RsbU (phosphoserine phosphatase)